MSDTLKRLRNLSPMVVSLDLSVKDGGELQVLSRGMDKVMSSLSSGSSGQDGFLPASLPECPSSHDSALLCTVFRLRNMHYMDVVMPR